MRKLFIGFAVMLLMIFAVVPAASAMDLRQGTRPSVARDEVVDDDLFIAGDSMTIEGTVNGDVLAFGNNVTVRGTINGNLLTAGSHVEVLGTVTGSVYGAAETLYVGGRIERTLAAAGSRVTLDANSSVGQSVMAAADRFLFASTVGRGMAVAGNAITIDGRIGKELRAAVNELRINSTAVVSGPVEYASPNKAYIDAGARTGEVTYTYRQYDWNHGNTFWVSRWWKFISFASFLGFGMLILTLFPALRRSFPDLVLEKPWQLPVTGIVTIIVFPIAFVVLLLTVIGIPVSLLSLAALPVLIYVGQVLVSYAVGKLLGDRVPFMANWTWPALFLVGAVLTTAANQIPGFGWLCATATFLYGFGGVLWTLFAKRQAA
ncbi:MAG TPA: hypothetical protein VNT01_15285 [Symbiobacteriaceae bacterium]|nr:hypothetical protein [Symbiobacteriaceae bacterium]